MNIQAPFTFASVYSLWVWCFAGLRLRAVVGAFGKLWGFLASGPYFTGASSCCFKSQWPLLLWPFSCVGSNPALKPTRILRAAYLVR